VRLPTTLHPHAHHRHTRQLSIPGGTPSARLPSHMQPYPPAPLPSRPPPRRFGGTCVGSSERIRNAAKLMIELSATHKMVVVSAMGTPGKGVPKARSTRPAPHSSVWRG